MVTVLLALEQENHALVRCQAPPEHQAMLALRLGVGNLDIELHGAVLGLDFEAGVLKNIVSKRWSHGCESHKSKGRECGPL